MLAAGVVMDDSSGFASGEDTTVFSAWSASLVVSSGLLSGSSTSILSSTSVGFVGGGGPNAAKTSIRFTPAAASRISNAATHRDRTDSKARKPRTSITSSFGFRSRYAVVLRKSRNRLAGVRSSDQWEAQCRWASCIPVHTFSICK